MRAGGAPEWKGVFEEDTFNGFNNAIYQGSPVDWRRSPAFFDGICNRISKMPYKGIRVRHRIEDKTLVRSGTYTTVHERLREAIQTWATLEAGSGRLLLDVPHVGAIILAILLSSDRWSRGEVRG